MVVSEAKRRANTKYAKEKQTHIGVRLRLDEDADIIRNLEKAKKYGYSSNEWLQALYRGERLV